VAALELHHEVLFNALAAIWTADSNKLSGGSFSKGVRDFVRAGDRRTGNLVMPYIEVVIEDQRSDSLDRQYVECVATLVIHTNPDQSHTDQDDVASEINRLYHDVSLAATGTDWKFGRCFVGSMRQLGSNTGANGKALRFAVPIKVIGYKVAGSGIRALLGGEGQVTWTEGSSGEDIQAALVEVVDVRVHDTQSIDFRPFGEGWAKPRGLLRGGTLVLRQKVGAGANYAAHIPNGIAASVVVYADKNNSSISKWTFSARIRHTRWGAQGGEAGGQPQTVYYEANIDGAVTETA
jgi:hypothetical protein